MGQTPRRHSVLIAAALLVGGMLTFASSAAADVVGGEEVWVPTEGTEEVIEADCPEGPNLGRVHFTIGADIPTMYFFRGILREDRGFIFQPYADASFELYEGDGFLKSFVAYGGVWNSVQSELTGSTDPNGPEPWYQFDATVGGTLNLWDFVDLTGAYTTYNSPNGAFDTYHDVLIGLGFNDEAILGKWALNPELNFFIETRNSAFGPNSGDLFQLNLGWNFPISRWGLDAVFSIPFTLGASIDNYYEVKQEDGGKRDPGYGYIETGMSLGIPLKFVPSTYGSWLVDLGFRWVNVGKTLIAVNNGDTSAIFGKFGFVMSY